MFYLNYLPAENSFYYSKEKKDFNVVCYKNLEMVERFSMEDYSVMLNITSDEEPMKRLRRFKKWREENPYEYGLNFLSKKEVQRTNFIEMCNDDAYDAYYSEILMRFADDIFPIRTYFRRNENGDCEIYRAEHAWLMNRKEVYLLYDEKTNDFYFSLRKEKQMRVVCKYPTANSAMIIGSADLEMIYRILESSSDKEKDLKALVEWRKRNPHSGVWNFSENNSWIEEVTIRDVEEIMKRVRAVVE